MGKDTSRARAQLLVRPTTGAYLHAHVTTGNSVILHILPTLMWLSDLIGACK